MNVSSDKNISIESATAKEADVRAGQTLSIRKLATGNDATLTSGDSMTVLDSDIGKALSMTSGKDISVNRSQSVTLDMNAKGSIETTGSDASISSGDVTMTAGENIRVTDSGTMKLDGVDTSEPAQKTTGVGQVGSVVYGNAAPTGFDVTKKGGAVLSSTGSMKLNGKIVEADTVKAATQVDLIADNVGIDDLQSQADEATIHVQGQDGNQAHYVGIHTTSSGAVTLADSKVEHLQLSGNDNVGLRNTTLGGNSTIQTKRLYVQLRRDSASTLANQFGTLRIKGIDVDSDVPFTRADDGIWIDGDPYYDTAYSQMWRSLFGLQELGAADAEKEEEDEYKDTSSAIHIGTVSGGEQYRTIQSV